MIKNLDVKVILNKRKFGKVLEPAIKKVAEEVGYGVVAKWDQAVINHTTAEAGQGDTNNLARSLFSTLSGYSSDVWHKVAAPSLRASKYGWGRNYRDVFGTFTFDNFYDNVSMSMRPDIVGNKFLVSIMLSNFASSAEKATKIYWTRLGKRRVFKYVYMDYNIARIGSIVDSTKSYVKGIVAAVKAKATSWIGMWK